MDQTVSQQPELGDAARKFIEKPKKLFIGGEWVEATSGRTFDAIDPVTEGVICQIPEAGKDDVDRAVKAARQAFDDSEWRRVAPADRQRMILKLADLLEQNAEEFAQLESLDVGKVITFARMIDVGSTVEYLRYMAGWATKIYGHTLDISSHPPGAEFQAYTLREPVGVCAQIIPWNFPLAMAAWKLGPALATGCTCVLKPAEQTNLTALRLGELIQEAGIPAGVVNIVTGQGETTGAALVDHPGIDKIAFTGSTSVGKSIGKAAMDSVKRVSLELGGKSPVVVLDDADVEQAIQGAANAIFFNQGQVCAAGSRLHVAKPIFDKVVAGVADIAKSMKLGPGLDPNTQMGPLVSQEQMDRVLGYIEKGQAEGGKLATGGHRAMDTGYFVEPTVITDCDAMSTVCQEEIFGPVLVARPFDSIDEIAAEANQTNYGLAASVWTSNLTAAHRLTKRIKAGTVWVNMHNMVDPNLPFGGYKQSGIGREMSKEVIDLYTETKSVLIHL